jgi:hypothetical protein
MRTELRAWRRRQGWALVCLLLLRVPAHGTDVFDIAAAAPPRVIAGDYFGTHFHRLDHAGDGYPATAWPDELVGSVRLWDSETRWADLEPSPGRFDFTRLDALVGEAERHHATVLLVLGSPPRWASARPDEAGPYGPGSAAEPRELGDWDRYLAAIVQRYRGRITQYELWNEPYFSDFPEDRAQASAFFTGSAATMVELARHARAVIARDDPGARLLTPGFVGASKRLALFLKSGGARYVDDVAYHFYVEDDAELVRLYADVRGVMARNGLGGRGLLNTESGFALRGAEGQPIAEGQAPIDRRRAAILLSRSLVLGAWLGIARFYQYAWDNGRMGMSMPDGRTPTDSLRAYAAVRRWLLGTTLEGCRSTSAGVVHCDGVRGDARLVVAWRTDGGPERTLAQAVPPQTISIESALDGAVAGGVAAGGSVALPSDGTPIAIWMRLATPARHMRVTPDR